MRRNWLLMVLAVPALAQQSLTLAELERRAVAASPSLA